MASGSTPGFPATVRISSLRSAGKGGPAFVGQVFSMCDLSGTGLMAVSTHFDIPFITKRTPEWIKKIFTAKSERNGPVFRFFMDLGDAVSYVKRLNIPSGVVGACRLDLAYEHFKEKPHLFQFVPNEKQVKEANKLLKIMSHNGGRKKVDGVPVFSAQNLDIAIATTDGIQWNVQRRRDAIDDNLSAEMIEETGESIWEPPEVQEVLNEVGDPGIPLSVISKAAEIQLLYAVDKVLLGNRWLRKATGIQPKFPYMVDSFEERSAASLLRASNSESENNKCLQHHGTSKLTSTDSVQAEQGQRPSFQFPFEDWSWHPFSKLQKNHNQVEDADREYLKEEMQSSPLLPRITMVGISTVEAGQVSKAGLKKTMEDLTRELEQTDQGNAAGTTSSEFNCDDRDPLFVANVGDYYSGAAKTGSVRWVRGGN
ncbi:Tic22-like family protein [Actinidia rufa]|uniref:Tic22-like family protein n=1 Tax=Actinidia rufa TaxID=165716 RepID=A0A7J0EEU1_9ERIC|nr:Tic22-like family protein [Actinidia rufa]